MNACPACGKELPGEFPFCPFCAAPLAAPTAEGAKERKVVSILFCDLVGFTGASESADPEEVQARLAPYHGFPLVPRHYSPQLAAAGRR